MVLHVLHGFLWVFVFVINIVFYLFIFFLVYYFFYFCIFLFSVLGVFMLFREKLKNILLLVKNVFQFFFMTQYLELCRMFARFEFSDYVIGTVKILWLLHGLDASINVRSAWKQGFFKFLSYGQIPYLSIDFLFGFFFFVCVHLFFFKITDNWYFKMWEIFCYFWEIRLAVVFTTHFVGYCFACWCSSFFI